jgi:hypothetical protein
MHIVLRDMHCIITRYLPPTSTRHNGHRSPRNFVQFSKIANPPSRHTAFPRPCISALDRHVGWLNTRLRSINNACAFAEMMYHTMYGCSYLPSGRSIFWKAITAGLCRDRHVRTLYGTHVIQKSNLQPSSPQMCVSATSPLGVNSKLKLSGI